MSKYLQLDYKSGFFFEYSTNEKEGYEKVTSTTGKVGYRKYYKEGVSGVLESVSLYDGKFGKQISMTIKDSDGDLNYLPVDIKDQKGNVAEYAESLTKLLPKLEKGLVVTVRGYNFLPEGQKYKKVGISITVADTKLQGLTNAYYDKEGNLVEGNIPAILWEEDPLDSSKKTPSMASVDAKNKYLLKVIKEQTDRLQYVKNSDNSPQPKKEEPKQEAPKNAVPTATPSEAFPSAISNEIEDKLPF
jgi:hypothetical protein